MAHEPGPDTPYSLSMNDVAGTWKSDEAGQPYLNFNNEGAAWGTDGCNGINTTYSLEGSTVTLEPWISTMRACMGVNDWLRNARFAEVDGDTMTVSNRDGEEIGTLRRSAGDVRNA